jgi:GNAT superfamily N-acetyltransferase
MIKVRIANTGDINDIYDLIVANSKYHSQEKYVLTDKKELKKSGFGRSSKFGVLLAECEGRIAGYVSYTWGYSIWEGATYMNIDDLFVWEEYRGKKVGEALIQNAKKVCKARGVYRLKWEVEQNNLKAINVYERLGVVINIKGICRWDIL